MPDQANRDNDTATVRIEWLTPGSDWDMTVFRDSNNDGSSAGETVVVGQSATGAPGTSEQVTIADKNLVEGRATSPAWSTSRRPSLRRRRLVRGSRSRKVEGKKERWTVICKTRKGKVTGTAQALHRARPAQAPEPAQGLLSAALIA